MTAGADKPKTARVEYLDRDQIKALREKESEARKHRAREEQQRGDRIMSALDKLGQRLVESESERQSLKDLIDQAKDHQKELQTKIEESRRKQQQVEDDLHGVKQQNMRLNRKLEQQDQARARLNRRMQRLEIMAQDAQSALESKAMVLLTDQSMARQAALPQARAGEPLPLAIDHQAAEREAIEAMPWWQRPARFSTGAMLMTGVAAIALGLLVAKAFDRNDSAFAVMQDGSLARIDLNTGSLKPIRIQAEEIRTPGGRLFAMTRSQRGESKLTYDPEGIEAQTNRGRMEALEIMNLPAIDKQIDADMALRGEMKVLQDQALGGNAEAQHDLAALYTAGQGVTQDYDRAITLFKLSANQGVANAAYNLGVLYHQGLGVDQNMPLALDWYRRAALLGHPEAEYNLGIAYIEGIGTAFNPPLAAAMFQQAAMKGIMEAAYNLGLILENVLVEGSRPRDALIWYRAAMEGGSAEARNALSALAQKLDIPFETAGRDEEGEPFSALVSQARQDRNFDWPESYIMPDILPDTQTVMMMQLQQQMTRLGSYSGAADGIENEALRQSIQEYKEANAIAGLDLTFVEFFSLLLTLRTGV